MEPRDLAPALPPRAEPGSRYAVLFVRRKPRMVAATHGPIRHDPGTITLQRDYLELDGTGVRYQGWQAIRVLVPAIAVLPGAIGAPIGYLLVMYAYPNLFFWLMPVAVFFAISVAALTAYFLAEYAFTRPLRIVVPLIHIRRVVLDPLRGTVMLGVSSQPTGPTVWHSFATAYAWAIFDGLEPLLDPGTCGLITRRDRALARGDLAMFLAMCALTPVVGMGASLAGAGAGLLAAILGERRYGLFGALLCLAPIVGQVFLIRWWVSF